MFFLVRVAEQERRVVGDDELGATQGVDGAAPAGEWALFAGEIGDGGLAEGDDDLGAD